MRVERESCIARCVVIIARSIPFLPVPAPSTHARAHNVTLRNTRGGVRRGRRRASREPRDDAALARRARMRHVARHAPQDAHSSRRAIRRGKARDSAPAAVRCARPRCCVLTHVCVRAPAAHSLLCVARAQPRGTWSCPPSRRCCSSRSAATSSTMPLTSCAAQTQRSE
jgi:hypothetical protein